MNTKDIIKAINEFVYFIENGTTICNNLNNELLKHLDALGLAYAYTNYIEDNKDYPEPPDQNYEELYKNVGNKFKDYGHYNLAKDIEDNLANPELMVADAIDDIVDIYIEMKEIQWRFINTSKDDALELFSQMYGHWGFHLRELQWYVFYKQIK